MSEGAQAGMTGGVASKDLIMEKHGIVLRQAPSRQGRKIEAYEVLKQEDSRIIAMISWYPPWHQYAFFPFPQTVWKPTCLVALVQTIEKLTKELKRSRGLAASRTSADEQLRPRQQTLRVIPQQDMP